MPTLPQAHAIVSREGWLSYTPPPFRQTVLARCKLEALKAGATIYSVGDPPGGMYGLVRGSFALSIAPGERGPYVAHFARPGTWFGEAAAFTEQPRRISLAVTRNSNRPPTLDCVACYDAPHDVDLQLRRNPHRRVRGERAARRRTHCEELVARAASRRAGDRRSRTD
jgi:Cyclic nucleotide-binding domain